MENETQQIHIHSFNPKQFHKAVRNYLTNELGISKESVEQQTKAAIEAAAEKYIKNHLAGSDFFQRMIREHIGMLIKTGISSGTYYSPNEAFEQFIKRTTEQVIRDEVLNRYKINITDAKGERYED